MAPSVSSPACSPNPLSQLSRSSLLFLTCRANLDSGPGFQLPRYLLLAVAYSVGSEGPDPCVHSHTMKTSPAGKLAMGITTLASILMQEVCLRKLSSVLSPYWEREPDKGRYFPPIIAATAYCYYLLQPLTSTAAMLLPASCGCLYPFLHGCL